MKLAVPPDFDFDWTLGFLAARVVPSLEGVEDGEYRRSLRVDGRPVTLAVRFQPGELTVRSSPRLPQLRRLVTRMFDLDADLDTFHKLAAGDPLLRNLVASRPWIRLPQYLDPFEGTVRAILGQQVSLAAASTMVDRLVRRVGDPAPDSFLAFPSPAAVAALGTQGLLELGLTRAKAAALHGLALADLDWERLRTAPAEEAEAELDALPGIGPWTASYVRMRTLGDRDAFPAADLGVIKALRALLAEEPSPKRIAELAESWRPWRAYATLHLWHSLG
ncbi:MAG TPA: AlkA N-terminal domain-containing protein [Thermoanaerobaculia bacterium]|nr:AlkA N-terminal domain-containing protein [Thermoanaerobaculia bacterium]